MRWQFPALAGRAVEARLSVVLVVPAPATAAPVPGASVRVEGAVDRGDRARWETLFEGTTDAAGRVTWKAPGNGTRAASVQRIVAQLGKDVLVLDPSHPPGAYRDGQWPPRRQDLL